MKKKILAILLTLSLISGMALPGTMAVEAETASNALSVETNSNASDETVYTGTLICGLEEHSHSEGECYTLSEEPTCGLTQTHVHDDNSCYEMQEQEDEETGEMIQVKVLICEEEEIIPHEHGDGCYTAVELTCAVALSEGHTHGEGCYLTTTELTCGLSEDENHTHGDDCYTATSSLVCTEAESAGHAHEAACYSASTLTCNQEEIPEHTHGTDCYKMTLTCEKTEHQHTAECYQAEDTCTCGAEGLFHNSDCPLYAEPVTAAVYTEENGVYTLLETHDGANPLDMSTYNGKTVYVLADTQPQSLYFTASGLVNTGVTYSVSESEYALLTSGGDKFTNHTALLTVAENAPAGREFTLSAKGLLVTSYTVTIKVLDKLPEMTVTAEGLLSDWDGMTPEEKAAALEYLKSEEGAEVYEAFNRLRFPDINEDVRAAIVVFAEIAELLPQEEIVEYFKTSAALISAWGPIVLDSTYEPVEEQEAYAEAASDLNDAFPATVMLAETEESSVFDEEELAQRVNDALLGMISAYFDAEDAYGAGLDTYLKEKSPLLLSAYSTLSAYAENDIDTYDGESTKQAVGSETDNIKITLFNYGAKINNASDFVLGFKANTGTDVDYEIGSYGQGEHYYALGTTVNGYPLTTSWLETGAQPGDDGLMSWGDKLGSLQYLFDQEGDAYIAGDNGNTTYIANNGNYQFQRFEVDTVKLFTVTGSRYVYDSAYNAAEYDISSKSLTAYDYALRPFSCSGDGEANLQGHFLPFNSIDQAVQLVDSEGNEIEANLVEGMTDLTNGSGATSLSASEVKNLYALKGGEENRVDMAFGMTIEFTFSMPQNGQIDGEDMVFEFAGDDDVLVYIDGKPVLNVGGAHAATKGTINFKTGKVSEKYCGDALLQKTFVEDCISKKVVKNTGQREQVLVENCHPAIISREKHNEILAELARRSAIESPSTKQASTGMACYSSKYALTERLVCGECGTLYRRCVWKRNGVEKVVWRCVSRLDYGTKYCHESPTMEETALQKAIMEAINAAMDGKPTVIKLVTDAMAQERVRRPANQKGIGEIDQRLKELDAAFSELLEDEDVSLSDDCMERFQIIADERAKLKKQKAELEARLLEDKQAVDHLRATAEKMQTFSPAVTEWNEMDIRQIIHTVKVESAEWIEVTLTDGKTIRQRVENKVRKRRQ